MKIVRLFYNLEAMNDVIIVKFNDDIYTHYERKGDVCVIYNDSEVIGYNIFNFNNYYKILNSGYIQPNLEIIKIINEILTDNQLPTFEADLEDKIVVGEVVECTNHPKSEHLHILKVNVGSETLQIVCGAANAKEGIRVVVSKVNAVLPDGMLIKPSKMLGVDSYGMCCSLRELRLTDDLTKKGIIELDSSYEIGSKFLGSI